jgi:predicted dienelactone hydrolase
MSLFRVSSLVLGLIVARVALTAQAPGVGVTQIEVPDPVSGSRMPGFVFYPSTRPGGGPTTFGPYRVEAATDAPKPDRMLPLVVLSHGQGSSNLAHHDLATYLAAHGLIVATIEHAGDNFRDSSGVGRPQVLFGRARQISALISALLTDPLWRERIDANRIGAAGFSMGAYTTLLLVGGVPRWDRLADYCVRRPQDRDTCGLLERLGAASGKRSVRDYLQAIQAEQLHWKMADTRVAAAFAMAPMSVVFERDGAAGISRPVLLYYAENDHVLPPKENALHLAPLVVAPLTTRIAQDAGHYVFLSPCPSTLAQELAEICADPPGVNRVAAHEQINADALAFFRRALNLPPPQ